MNQAAWVSVQDLFTVSPMIAIIALSLIPVMIKVFRGNREPSPFVTLAYSMMALLVAIGLTLPLSALANNTQTAFSGALVLDGISIWTSIILYIITAVGLMLAYDHVATNGRQFSEYCFLILSSLVGMIILVMANDLIVTFIGLEMMSLCLYILVAMSRERILSKEAAFKYFVLGSFASAIFLYGIALLYGTVGSTYFPDIADATGKLIGSNRIFMVGMGLTILGFAFKVSVFPLHAWTPDVYQGAATPVTAFMSTAVKAATFVAFLRLFRAEGFAESESLLNVMTWLAVLTMTIGNVAAIMQDNFKRMLAYSSVAHSGYAMIALIVAGFGSNFDVATEALLFYLFSYAIMTLGSFALVALFEKREDMLINVGDLKGLASRYPWLALSLTILMLSLAGIPPTLGFFGKFYVFRVAIEQDMYWLVFWGVINSVISVYYYLRPVVLMYMSEEQSADVLASKIMTSNFMTRATVIVMALLIVVLGVYSSPVIRAVQRSVLSLF